MSFDIRTAILGLAVGNLVFGSILVLFQRGEEPSQRISFLVTCKLLQGIGWLLLSGRGSIPDFLSFAVGNSCLLSGIAYESWSMYRLTGRPVSRRRHVYSAAGITLICILSTPLTAAGRIVVASFIAVIFYALSGQALLNRPSEKSMLHGYLGGSAWLFVVILSIRGLWALVAPENFTLFAADTIQLITFATFYYLTLTNGVGVLLLTKQIADRELRDSEARFRSYFELPIIGIAITSPDKGWLDVNVAVCEMLGYTRTELMQMTWAELTHPDDITADLVQFNRVQAGEIEGYRLEKRFIHKAGHCVHIDLAVQCLRRPDRSVDYFVALLQDITDRKQAEVALRESEAKFRAIIQQSSEGIMLLDEQGRIIEWNPAQAQITGISQAEALGQPAWEIQARQAPDAYRTPERIEDARQALIDLLTTGQSPLLSGSIEGTFENASGESRNIIQNNFLIKTTHGYRVGAIVHDVTARKCMEDALRQREGQLRAVIETNIDGMLVMSEQGVIHFINPAAAALLNRSESEMLNEAFGLPIIQNQSTELELVRSDQARRVIELRATSILWQNTPALLVSLRDITDRKRAEEALRDSERFARAIADHVPGLLGYWTHDLRCAFANKEYVVWFGRTVDQMQGIHMADLMGAELFSKNEPYVRAALRGEDQRFERTLIKTNGEIGYTWAQYIPYRVRDEVQGFFALVTDITAIKQSQEQLRELNATLEQRVADRTVELQAANLRLLELDRLKDDFLSRTSHELRTPLTAILLSLELLETAAPEKRERYLQRLKHAAQRLREMIEDVLLFSRLNLYTRPDTLSLINLNDLLASHFTT